MVVICKNCGQKVRVNIPKQVSPITPRGNVTLFEASSPMVLGGGRKLTVVTPDVVTMLARPLNQTIALTIPIMVGTITATEYLHWNPLVSPIVFCVSFSMLLGRFSRFMTWHDPAQSQSQDDDDNDDEDDDDTPEPQPELSTHVLAWADVQKTDGGARISALIVPNISQPDKHIPVKMVQRVAIAIVNNGMEWVDERSLNGIGRTAYRSIREEWIHRGYASSTPDKKTILTEHGKVMTRKVAMTPPE